MKSKLYVPLMNSCITESTRKVYADSLRQCGADCVFLALERETFFAFDSAMFEKLKENISYFEAEGFECGVWVQAFGFGATEKNHLIPKGKYTRIKSVRGAQLVDAFCPECENYMHDYLIWIERVVKTGTRIIMLDDDLCLSVRPGLGCFCDKHISLLEAELGESLAGKDLPSLFFTGKPGRYRDTWLKVQRDTLMRFAGRVRCKVDEIDPTVRMGFCAGYTSWDIEGADAMELTRALAGGTKPFLRFTGAPYWVSKCINRFDGMGLGSVNELARLQEAWCRNSGIEIFAEADSYPRPRYHVPANYIECFDAAITASGGMGDLKYLFEYYAEPQNETGYVKHHIRTKALRDFLHKHFDDKNADGIYIAERMKKFGDMILEETFAGEQQLMDTANSPAAAMLSSLGIPSVYDKESGIAVAFDNNVDSFQKLPQKLILDIKAAQILLQKGVDVGIESIKQTEEPIFEHFENVRTPLFAKAKGIYYNCALKENAKVLSTFENAEGFFTAVYTYYNGECEFLVLCFDAYTVPYNSSLLVSYGRQSQLTEFVGDKFCYIKKQPGIYQICKRDNSETAVFFENLCEDVLFDFDIELDNEYSSMILYGVEGDLDCKKLHITSEVAPYAMFAVVLKK